MEDYHGMINLPVPRSQRYQAQGGRGSVSLGRMQPGGVGLPNVVSGLAIGGPSVARGLDQWADVLYKQEQERQDMETVKEMTLFQDKEREFQARMLQTKGLSAYESFRMTEDFYKTNGQELSGKARGTYQKEIYAKFLAGRENAGKDLAVRHQIAQHEVYKGEVYDGQSALLLRSTAEDPEAWRQNSDSQIALDQQLNPDRAPELQAARNAQTQDNHIKNAVLSAADGNKWDRAQELLDNYRKSSGGDLQAPAQAQRYMGIVQNAAASSGVPEGLVLAVMKTESNFDPNAVSHAGARGLMQLMPGTARDLGVSNPHDPAQSIRGGTRYLGQMLKKYGNVSDALMAYNWGPGSVDKWISKGRQGRVPEETRNYVAKVTGHLKSYGGGGAPNPVLAMALQKKIDQGRAEDNREFKAQVQTLPALVQDEMAMIVETGKDNPAILPQLQEAVGRGLKTDEAIAEYEAKKQQAYEIHDWISDPVNQGISIPEQMERAATELNPDQPQFVGQYHAQSKVRDGVLTALREQYTRLNNDPMGFVADQAEKVVQKEIADGQLKEDDQAAVVKARVDISKQLALDLGLGVEGLNNFPLSKGQVDNLGKNLAAAENPQQRLATLSQVYENYGEYAEKAFEQLGADYSELLAVEAARSGDPLLMRTAQLAVNRPEKLVNIKSPELDMLVTGLLSENDLGEVLEGRLKNSYGLDPEAMRKRDGLRTFASAVVANLIENGGLSQSAAAGEMRKVLDGLTGGTVAINENYASIYLKTDERGKAEDKEDVLAGLRVLSQDFGDDYYWINDGDDYFVLSSRLSGRVESFDGVRSARVSRADAAYVGGSVSGAEWDSVAWWPSAAADMATAEKNKRAAENRTRTVEVIARMKKEAPADEHGRFIEAVRANSLKEAEARRGRNKQPQPEPVKPPDGDQFIEDPLLTAIAEGGGA